MRPAVAFACGLWIGALAALGAGGLWLATRETAATRERTLTTAATDQELGQLRALSARLTAENARLRETIDAFRNELAVAAPVPATTRAVEPRAAAPPEPGPPSLAEWEARARQNDAAAVAALGDNLVVDRGETLLRLWESGRLDLPNQRVVAWYLGAMVEINPRFAAAVRALFADDGVEPELWLSALDGLVTPAPGVTDFQSRVELVGALEESAPAAVLPQLELARKQLLRLWTEAEDRAAP